MHAVAAAQPADFSALADAALNPVYLAQAIERATVHPWVVSVLWLTPEGKTEGVVNVTWAAMSNPPEPEDLIPAGCALRRAEVYPASRFGTLPITARGNYAAHYKQFLLARKARAYGVSESEMLRSCDMTYLDESVARWKRGAALLKGEWA
jgi:hypothetical protein